MLDKAFISLAKQNAKFREDFSALAHDTTLSFTGSNEGNWFNGDGKTTFALPKLNTDTDNTGVKYIICISGIYPSH